ncbi:MAG: Rep catalytic domain protein [Circoviridae sp.]|nr:MAG: Rep catalytic domain protein [Circoviridae sp.]
MSRIVSTPSAIPPRRRREARRLNIRARKVLLTWPQTEADPEKFLWWLVERFGGESAVNYVIVCQEEHKKTGGIHMHAFAILTNDLGRFDADKFDYEGRHCNIKGVRSIQKSIEYVRKDGKWADWGEEPAWKKHVDTKEKNAAIREMGVARAVEEGIIPIHQARNILAAVNMLEAMELSERKPPTVYWFYGPTGSGKTRRAWEVAGQNAWISSQDLRWFDGYNGQRGAILDDLRSGSCAMNFLLRLLDRYPLNVPIKGGFVFWKPEVIVITCPVKPEELFVNRETGEQWDHIDQVIRRVDHFRDFAVLPYGQGEEADEANPIEVELTEEPNCPPELPVAEEPIIVYGYDPILDYWSDGTMRYRVVRGEGPEAPLDQRLPMDKPDSPIR